MWLFFTSWTIKDNFKKYEDKFSNSFVENFLDSSFFFMKLSFLFLLLEHMARRTKKYMHQKKLVYDDSFGADISSICTASIFIRMYFPFTFFSFTLITKIISVPLSRLYIQIKYRKYSLFNYHQVFQADVHFITRICMNFFGQNIFQDNK